MTSARSVVPVIETLPERKYLRRLLHSLPPTEPVVLIGSWARGTAGPGSDIDVLVVADARSPLPPPRLQVVTVSPSEFRRRLMKGDDFSQWALRFGVPIAGRRRWEGLREELLPRAPWPDPALKLGRAMKKLETAQVLLAMGDLAAAEEEIRFGLSHIARAGLLSRHVFPLSRPELAGQLEEIGDPLLARMLRRADDSAPMTEAEIREALGLVTDRLAAAASSG